jgi:hypothetical protein
MARAPHDNGAVGQRDVLPQVLVEEFEDQQDAVRLRQKHAQLLKVQFVCARAVSRKTKQPMRTDTERTVGAEQTQQHQQHGRDRLHHQLLVPPDIERMGKRGTVCSGGQASGICYDQKTHQATARSSG